MQINADKKKSIHDSRLTAFEPPMDADKFKSNQPQRTQRARRKQEKSNHESRLTVLLNRQGARRNKSESE